MHLCIYEDALADNFLPLTFFRPVYDLRCGVMTLREKIGHGVPHTGMTLHVRPFLADVLREQNHGISVNRLDADCCLFVNGRIVMTPRAAVLIRRQKSDLLFVKGDEIVGACLSGRRLDDIKGQVGTGYPDFSAFADLPRIVLDVTLLVHPWDILSANAAEIIADHNLIGHGISSRAKIHAGAILAGRSRIAVGKGSVIGPGAVLDAREGPVVVGRDVRIYPGAVLEGPCAIGDGSVVRIHAKIYAGTSIGPVCKVGGEIEGSVIHSHANKQHDGFLGDSYLGMWVNLGAGTTNSNLKNTYGTIRMEINGHSVDTGRIFAGLIAGDHTKTGINSTINTGTVIGPSSNIFGGGLPPKSVPAFAWGGAAGFETYQLEKALAVAVTVMSRRNVTASDAYKDLFRHVYSMTAHEREHFTS